MIEPLYQSSSSTLSSMERGSSLASSVRRGSLSNAGRSTCSIDYQDVPRQVAVLIDEYASGFVDPRHTHKRAQLLYATTGVLSVTTDRENFVVPSRRAVWVPAGVPHQVACRGRVSLCTLYIDTRAGTGLPGMCQALDVSDLLRELIVASINFPIEYDLDGREGRIMALILDEIAAAPRIPLQVPMPQDTRLLRICRAILDDPAHADTLGDWARVAGMGRRTVTRMFRRETRTTFAAWRQHVRLMEALSRLADGEPVTKVAFEVGYSSPSAFAAMFRRTFGSTPTRYILGSAPRPDSVDSAVLTSVNNTERY